MILGMVEVSRTYAAVRGQSPHPDTEIDRALAGIRDLDVSTAYPLVTALLERADAGTLSRDRLLLLLRALASFVLRRFVCGAGSKAYARWFVSACRGLPADPTQHLIAFLAAKGWPSDEEFRARFVRFNLYESKYAHAVLATLERASQAKSEPVGLEACSIEHVLPQTVDETADDGRSWIEALGGEQWRPAHAEWLHTPGNLTLVGADYNASMSNRAFELKRPVLAASKVYMNLHFKSATPPWTPANIEARGKELAGLAATLWPAQPSV